MVYYGSYRAVQNMQVQQGDEWEKGREGEYPGRGESRYQQICWWEPGFSAACPAGAGLMGAEDGVGEDSRSPVCDAWRKAKTQPINRLEDTTVERGLSIVPNRNIF